LDGITGQVITGTYVAPERGKISVGEWANKWIAGKVSLKPSTAATYKSILKHHVKARWARVALVDVTHEDVAEWIGDLLAGGLSASRTRQVHTIFAAMLDAAVRARRLAANPARGVELPRLPAVKHRYLTHAEVAALADACGEYGTLVRVLAYGGLRFGEAAALRAENIDVHDRRRVRDRDRWASDIHDTEDSRGAGGVTPPFRRGRRRDRADRQETR
jgi:integrase